MTRTGREALLFLKKKKQKNFFNLVCTGETTVNQINKSFLFLFFKKEGLAFPMLPYTGLAGVIMKRSIALIGLALLSSMAPAMAATPAQIADGKMVATMTSMGNCDACHVFAGATEAGNIGPQLKDVKSLMPDRRTFYAIIYNEQARNPQTIMPPFGKDAILTPGQINDVIDFLYTK